MKAIVYERPDGGISVCRPVISRDDPKGFTEADALARALAKDIPPDAIGVHVVEPDDIPEDRTFRNAWKLDGKKVAVDMPKARELHKDRLRELRAPLLSALDVEFQRSYKDPAAQDAIEAKKQALRDVTADPAIEAAKTPEQLSTILPAGLKG